MVLAHHRLAEIELAERAALGHEDQRRDLATAPPARRARSGWWQSPGLHQHRAAQAAHPGAGDDADRLLLARRGKGREEIVRVQRLDQRREYPVGHIDDQLDVIGLERRQHDLVPGAGVVFVSLMLKRF